MITLRELTVFRAVMKVGTVSGASRLLSVSQPAVTKTLQQIEWKVGVPLFERMKGRLQPTAESALLFPKMERIFAAVEDLEQYAGQIKDGEVGGVSFATVTTLATSIATPAILNFNGSHPNVSVSVRALATRQVVEQVANNLVDFGLNDTASMEGSLKTDPICQVAICIVMRREHPLARKKSIAFPDLRDETVISFFDDSMLGALLRQKLRMSGSEREVQFATNQSLVASALVQGGAGVALIDPFTPLSGYFPDLIVRPLTPKMILEPRIIYPPNRPLSLAARELITCIKDRFASVEADLLALSP
ncbi:LysR family transcriptional regulator [Aliihoeflea sp. PC F10.4]